MDDIVNRYLQELLREKEQESEVDKDDGKKFYPADVARELVKDSDIGQLKLILDYSDLQEKINRGDLNPQDEGYKNLFNQAADIVYAKVKELDQFPEFKNAMDIWVVEVAKVLTNEYGEEIKQLIQNAPDTKFWSS